LSNKNINKGESSSEPQLKRVKKSTNWTTSAHIYYFDLSFNALETSRLQALTITATNKGLRQNCPTIKMNTSKHSNHYLMIKTLNRDLIQEKINE
jgi:hypothetical protein